MSTLTEWNLLKYQFDALLHDESVDADSIERTFDEQVRRRFAENDKPSCGARKQNRDDWPVYTNAREKI